MYAAAEVKSHDKAAKILAKLADLSISGRHVNRLAEEIGSAMKVKRDQEVEDYVHHRRKPPAESAPQVAVIGMDGGRVLTRTPGQGAGVHGQGWKEDKVACLLAMKGETFTEDPHPEPPKCFLDAPKVDEMVREIQANHGTRQENELPQLEELGLSKATTPAPASTTPANESPPLEQPVLAAETHRTSQPHLRGDDAGLPRVRQDGGGGSISPQLSRGVARRFLGDGGAWIWTQHAKWFSHMTAVADFVHPLTYLYVTATALSANVADRWQRFVGWMTQCWQGQVTAVIADMDAELARREPFTGKLPATDPREVLRRTIGYLRNNQERMNYPEYRKQGLPVTSSMVESLIKEFNYRVKGTEKFWDNPEGAEAILQLRAAVLSDDDRLQTFIMDRPGSATRCHEETEHRQAA